ncbi:MAG: hypothetical protein J5725_07610 [Bacteroidales bacterium]|nr:hypothetical protein [Bacteroidales bacterium]
MENGLSAADVALLNNDGMGGWNGMIWLFAILALFGGGGFGFGNANNQYATSSEVQRGFDTQNLNSQTSAILGAVNNGTAQTVAATNQTFHDSLMANQNLYNEIARDISNVQLGQANILANQNECCCSTKQLIMQNNYDAAMRDATTNANLTAQIQSVKDMISQNKIEELQAKISRLEMQNMTSNVLRFPTSWSYDAGQFPPIFGTAAI